MSAVGKFIYVGKEFVQLNKVRAFYVPMEHLGLDIVSKVTGQ
jgi:hypothetical protein